MADESATPGAGSGSVNGSAAERFSRGEPVAVEVDRIERALADLWKTASAGSEGTVSRAALWNLVVPTRAQDLARTREIVDELAPLLPARVLVLAEELETAPETAPGTVDGAVADGGARVSADEGVRASIESNVVARSSGARVVYSEEITLRGRRGDARFGSLVRALVIPGLPTATLWPDATMSEALLRRQLLSATDRLVLDTGRCARPRELIEVQRCAELAGAGIAVTDLGWLRLKGFRLLFAGLFDAPVGGAPLEAASRVTVHHRAGGEPIALLLAAWLASTLGWLFSTGEAPTSEGGPRFRFDRADRPPVDVVLRASPGECGTSGIVALELESTGPGGAELFAVRRTARNHATLTSPIAPPRVVKLDSRRDAELCVTALGPSGRDPLFARCLALASRLASSATSA